MTIEEQLASVKWEDPDHVIEFYDSNRLYYENHDVVKTEDKISEFVDIKLHYANALFKKSRYDKVLAALDQVSVLLKKLPNHHWNYSKSEQHVRYLTGMVLGHHKKYKEAFAIFKVLVTEDPDHYYYRVWYNHTKLGIYNWIFRSLTWLGFGLIVIDWFSSTSDKIGVDLGMVGLAIAGATYLASAGLNWYYKGKNPK